MHHLMVRYLMMCPHIRGVVVMRTYVMVHHLMARPLMVHHLMVHHLMVCHLMVHRVMVRHLKMCIYIRSVFDDVHPY